MSDEFGSIANVYIHCTTDAVNYINIDPTIPINFTRNTKAV